MLYLRANVEAALRLLPRLVESDGEIWLADPRRAGARDFLAAARSTFTLHTTEHGPLALHRLATGRRTRRGGNRPPTGVVAPWWERGPVATIVT